MATMFAFRQPHNMHAKPIALYDSIKDDGVALVLRKTRGKPIIGKKSSDFAHLA
jgi:hypothetical protein